MKVFKSNLFLLFFLFLYNFSFTQPAAGDIAFVGFNANNPDGFSFIILADIAGDAVINFTDKGYTAGNSFLSGEGTISWSAPPDGLLAGTVVHISNNDTWTASTGSLSGSITLAEAGDQILSYTGNESSPVFLAAIQYNSSGMWDVDAVNNDESVLPPELINGLNAVALPLTSNGIYIGNLDATNTNLISQINDISHWYNNKNIHLDIQAEAYPYNLLISSGNWAEPTNWKMNSIPDASVSAIITEGCSATVNDVFSTCKKLIIEPKASLTITSGNILTINNDLLIKSRSLTLTGSIISNGTLSISGETTIERYIPTEDWHLVSSPVSGQALNNFAATNQLEIDSTENDFDLAPYNEPEDSWGPYVTAVNSTAMVLGKGYSMRRADVAGTTGIVEFSGTLNTTNADVAISRNNYGWNCIGNPFPSAISATGTGSFLNLNVAELDPEYAALYVWDNTINDYITYNNTRNAKIAPCQGFIVKSKPGGGTISFTKAIQTHTTESFKSGEILLPTIYLTAQAGQNINTTSFVFADNMTPGLDPSFDAGKLKGNPFFSLYSKIDESNTGFAVQSLPLKNFSQFRIPLGLDFEKGGEVTFSATGENLPENMQIVLEDIQAPEYSHLEREKTFYTTTINAGSKGDGRFFLLFQEGEKTNASFNSTNQFKIFTRNNKIVIKGHVQTTSIVKLFSITGKICNTPVSISENETILDVIDVTQGIYLLQIKQNNKYFSEKIVISN